MQTPMHGLLNLDKPPGPSSAAVLNRLKRLLPPKTKIGHAGTLDPFATGVLVVLIGKATRLCESMRDQPKCYAATIKLGATTPTDDPESQEVLTEGATPPTDSAVAAAVQQFTGPIQQRPPAFSAMKINGRRAYDLARAGRPVDLPARPVRVDSIQITAYHWPLLNLTIHCGRGAYIRSLARDIGQSLSVGGYLTQLRRLSVGQFKAEAAVTLERLLAEGVGPHLIEAVP
jgi:tRNA pseudouridine55 synthase